MQTVLLVIHLLITAAMIGIILVQRSEGGMGLGGGNMGGLMTTRGSANLLTHATAILAACFLATSLLLAILASHDNRPSSILGVLTSPLVGKVVAQNAAGEGMMIAVTAS